jgi:PAS domain S-box-containing protein
MISRIWLTLKGRKDWATTATEQNPDAVFCTDDWLRIRNSNRAAEKLLGYGPGELRGKLVAEVFPFFGEEAPGGVVDRAGIRVLHRDGTALPVDFIVRRLPEESTNGSLLFVRKKTADTGWVEPASDPLTIILGYSDLLLETLHADDPVRGEIKVIRDAARSLAGIAAATQSA